MVLLNDSFTITCVLNGNINPPDEEILWKKDGKILSNGRIYTRLNATISNNGYYECFVRGVTNGTYIHVRGTLSALSHVSVARVRKIGIIFV